jgi:hypothetical protein
MFWSTTLIFLLATVVIVVGPGLTMQAIPGVIKYIDPSIAVGWSIHKIDVMTGVIAVITRINACFYFPFRLCRYNESDPIISLSSVTWSVHGELSFCGGMTAGSSSSSPPVSSELSVRFCVCRTFEVVY